MFIPLELNKRDDDYIENILLIIDNKILQEYNTYYFNKYPKRRVPSIKRPIPPSLNQWMIMKRPQMNNEKQKWGAFIIWLVNHYNYANIKIDKCIITYKFYMPTKRRFDLDNLTPKFLNDGLVEAGMLIDDGISHIKTIVLEGGYDKENPRVEILIEPIGDKI